MSFEKEYGKIRDKKEYLKYLKGGERKFEMSRIFKKNVYGKV